MSYYLIFDKNFITYIVIWYNDNSFIAIKNLRWSWPLKPWWGPWLPYCPHGSVNAADLISYATEAHGWRMWTTCPFVVTRSHSCDLSFRWHTHWLPVKQRIVYKLCLLMHLVHIGRTPLYLSQSLTTTASLHSRSHLRSASSCRYEQPRTRRKFGERAFTFAGPMHWNTLPQHLQTLTPQPTILLLRKLG